MAERDAGQPVDADLDMRGPVLAAGQIEVAPARRAAADENGVVALAQQPFQAVDPSTRDKSCAAVKYVADLLVDHLVRQSEFRDLTAHHAAGAKIGVENVDLVAERSKIAGDRERGGSGPDASNALAVAGRRRLGHQAGNIALVVGRDALQPADRDRLLLDPAAAAGGLARAIARSPQNSGKDVGLPINHIGADVIARRNAPNI